MIILLYGEDSFRAREKLNKIIKQYQAKHQSGLNLMRFSGNSLDMVKEKIGAVSMFDEKKLIILEDVFNKNLADEFFKYAKENKLKDNQDVIVVIYQEGKVAISLIKRKLSMLEKFDPLTGISLANWLKKQVTKHGGQINNQAANKLMIYLGDDLWQMNNEIQKLVSYKAGEIIGEDDVDLMIKAKIDVNIFKTLDALANQDKKTALRLLHEHLSQGENEIYLLSMLAYQVRTLLKLKDLIERGMPYYDLAKQTKLHPFVIKKSYQQIRNFSLNQLKKIYQRLLDIDIKIKIGRIDGPTGLDLLIEEM